MAIAECPQGHLYDPNLYASCPYCSGAGRMINFDNAGKTAAPSGYGAPRNATVAPQGYGAPQPQPQGGRIAPVAAAESVGKTVAPESYRKKAAEENKTVGVFQKKYSMDPVVGWLVCVEGADKGQDFHLFARINSIGRSSESDVCIKGDSTITRENHARIAYDPRHNAYQLIPGESTNNIYLNDQPVYVPVALNAYDLLELGQSKFVFLPLCGEKFQWEDYSRKG